MAHLDQFLLHYGYVAIFGLLMLGIVGPLIPDETILVLAGVLAHNGQLRVFPSIVAGIAGSMCGISLSYALGLYGFGWLERNWKALHVFAESHLVRAEQWFKRFGKWTLFFGYFVAGVRHFTALFAGISRMPFREFAPYAYLGSVCWVASFISVGYFAGAQWSRIGGTVDRVIVAAAVCICAALAIWWKWRTRSRDISSRPRP